MPPVLAVTYDQLNAWLVAFLWPFVRILALVGTAPVLSESSVPRQVKVGLAALLAIAIGPALGPLPAIPVSSIAGVWILTQQVLIGAAMGFSMQLIFAAVRATGEYVGLQMGLSFASFFDPSNDGTTTVLARLLHVLAILIFLSVDAHLMMIAALTESFRTLPIADTPLAAGGWLIVVLAGGEIFSAGLMLALPLVTALLILTLIMGILNRASPQFSIFAIGFPLTLLAGIVMLQWLMPHLPPFMEREFAGGLTTILRFTQGLRP